MKLGGGSDAVSPTAHYTGHVWVRNGLSHDELATWEGRLFYRALEPLMLVSRATGGPTLEGGLVARHRVIDELLTRAIEDGSVAQVVEIAAGMSPRGWRFVRRYEDAITYVEADLPAMAARKQRALDRLGTRSKAHRVVELDALRDDGPTSLAALAETLDHDKGLAVITEGLLTYLEHDAVLGLWKRIADVANSFPSSLYLSDLRLSEDAGATERTFYVFLSAFVRGRAGMHFGSEEEAVAALRDAGFRTAKLHRGDSLDHAEKVDPGARLIHIVDART